MEKVDKIIEIYQRISGAIDVLKNTVPGRTRRLASLKIDNRLKELAAFADQPLAKPEVVHDFLREQGLNWEKNKEDICITK